MPVFGADLPGVKRIVVLLVSDYKATACGFGDDMDDIMESPLPWLLL